MKVIRWTAAILIFGLAFFWSIRIHDYFFGVSSADQFGFLAVMLAGILFFSRFSMKESANKSLLLITLLLLAIFTIYPAISKLILFTDVSWLVIYLQLILTSLCLVYLFQSRALLLILLGFVLVFYVPYEFMEEQLRFYDRVESSIETRDGEAQVVRWKEDFWLYYNRQFQFSTLDKHVYQEAYVQPVMQLIQERSNVLLIGGDNGVVEDELSKFQEEMSLTVLILDKAFYDFSRSSVELTMSQFGQKEEVSDIDVFEFLRQKGNQFDLIIVDVPDPVNIHFGQYYTVEFYELVRDALTDDGFLVSQSGDYYKNGTKAQQIWNSVEKTGMHILPLQCQIPTIGQWSWVIGAKTRGRSEMRSKLSKIEPTVTNWWNQEAANLMMSFGKDYFSMATKEVNYLVEPAQSDTE